MRKESSTYDRIGQECRQDNSRQFSENWIVLLIAIELLILCGHRSKTQKWIALPHMVSLHKFQLKSFYGFQDIINVKFQN